MQFHLFIVEFCELKKMFTISDENQNYLWNIIRVL